MSVPSRRKLFCSGRAPLIEIFGVRRDHVVAGCERRRDAGLQQRELLERAAVQRQLPDLLVADQTAERARRRVDHRRGAG